MNRILRLTITIAALLTAGTTLRAQEDFRLVLGASFDTYFDNREYVDCQFGESQTLY